jgi:hypothetical protein
MDGSTIASVKVANITKASSRMPFARSRGPQIPNKRPNKNECRTGRFATEWPPIKSRAPSIFDMRIPSASVHPYSQICILSAAAAVFLHTIWFVYYVRERIKIFEK